MSRFFLALLLIPLAVGCDDSVSSASQLRRLRLLAVQAEPPNPVFGQTTQLRPLIFLPPGEGVTFEWSWCPVPTNSQDGYVCPVDQAAVDAIAVKAGLVGLPSLFLGSSESVAFTNPFPPALLASLCAGDEATTDIFTGSASEGKNSRVYACSLATLSVQVMLTIRGSTTDTGVVSLRLPIDESTPGNQNPVIAGIGLSSSGALLDPLATATVPRKSEVKLLAQVGEGQAETYLDRQLGSGNEYIRDGNGQYILAPTQERLTLSWFAEGGGFSERTTSWGPQDLDVSGQPLPFRSGVENSWSTPTADDYPAVSSLVIVVVRDSRGGTAWTQGMASLEVAP